MKEVITEAFCIGCGNCEAYAGDKFSLSENKFGLIEAQLIGDCDDTSILTEICPVVSLKNEDYFNEAYKEESLSYNMEVGYYRKVLAGYVAGDENRLSSSSGGITTHLLEQLFQKKMITGAIVVGSIVSDKTRTEYYIARSIEELKRSQKSKYHMNQHGDIIKSILKSGEDEIFAYVGVPCSVKAIKLLGEVEPDIKRKIKYTLSIFCGHQKSHAFAEYVGWQMGVPPEQLKSIDYRVKNEGNDASKYSYKVSGNDGELEKRVDDLKWMDWGLGLFKPKACDFCDDVAGESADIILGDAWHKKYSKSYKGTNLIITRKKELEDILFSSNKSGLIHIFEEKEKFIFDTQGGNFRHRHEGLLARKDLYSYKKLWSPPKSEKRLAKYKGNKKREEVYRERHNITISSHNVFLEAKLRKDINYFWEVMTPRIDNYFNKTKTFKGKVKKILKLILIWK